MRKLTVILTLTMVSSLGMAQNVPPFEQLLQDYRDFGLPLPPPEAPLAEWPTGWYHETPQGNSVTLMTLGFLLAPVGTEQLATTMAGPFRVEHDRSGTAEAPKIVDPERIDAEAYRFDQRTGTFSTDYALATAVQCHARGYEQLAKSLFTAAMAKSFGNGPDFVGREGGPVMEHRKAAEYQASSGDDARMRLAGIAWTYWLDQVVRLGSDREAVLKGFKSVIKTVPAYADDSRRALVRDLEAALIPSSAPPGSIKADIDALVDSGVMGGFMSSKEQDAAYSKILQRGFEAVPELIQHLDDSRLTRSVMQGFNNFPSMPRRLGEIAADLLQDIAGEELSRDWLQAQLGMSLNKASATAWWDKARKQGERDYLREHVLFKDEDRDQINTGQLQIIQLRYPELLPVLYREVLEKRPECESYSLMESLLSIPLPREEKVALFKVGAAHKRLLQRKVAVKGLRAVDPTAADAALLEVLSTFPKKIKSGSVWSSDESHMAQLVVESSSPAVWTAFAEATKRAHVSLRMELLKPLDYDYIGDRVERERVQVLAGFLADPTLRDQKADEELYSGPCAAFHYDKITVSDFVSLQIGSILNVEDAPDKDASPEHWTKFRARVIAEMARRGY